MRETATANGTADTPGALTNGKAGVLYVSPVFAPERLKELIAALEEPFDPTEIKWRVTNTTQIGSRNGPRFRGQMLAYADPRAYTDRLNGLFSPSGWTRDYTVQLVQNFERKGARLDGANDHGEDRGHVQGDDPRFRRTHRTRRGVGRQR